MTSLFSRRLYRYKWTLFCTKEPSPVSLPQTDHSCAVRAYLVVLDHDERGAEDLLFVQVTSG